MKFKVSKTASIHDIAEDDNNGMDGLKTMSVGNLRGSITSDGRDFLLKVLEDFQTI